MPQVNRAMANPSPISPHSLDDDHVLVPDSGMEIQETPLTGSTQESNQISRLSQYSSHDPNGNYVNNHVNNLVNNSVNTSEGSDNANAVSYVNSSVNVAIPTPSQTYFITNSNDYVLSNVNSEGSSFNQAIGNAANAQSGQSQTYQTISGDNTHPNEMTPITPMSQFIDLDSSSASTIIPGTDSSVIRLINLESSGEPDKTNPVISSNNENYCKKRKLNSIPNRIQVNQSSETSQTTSSYPASFSALDPSPVIHTRKFPRNAPLPSLNPSPMQTNTPSPTSIPPEGTPSPSQAKEQKIIIEPLNKINQHPADPTPLRNFFSNDLSLYKSIHTSAIGKFQINNVTKNLRKNLLIITLADITKESLKTILTIEELNAYKVKARLPAEEQFVRGVIGPVGTDTPLDEIKDSLLTEFPDLTRVERILKGPNKVPTLSIKLTFSRTLLPSVVSLGYQRFPVSAFVGRPWQCYNCQKFGHNADVCRSRAVCATCSENHITSSCPQAHLPVADKTFKCINCNDNHSASYGGCPKIKFAKKVEQLRAEQQLSYRDAVIKAQNSSIPPPGPPPVTQSHSRRLAATFTRSSPQPNPPRTQPIHPPPKVSNTSTQTEPLETSIINLDLISKITVFMIGLLKIKSPPDQKQISDLTRSIMGVTLTKDQLKLLDSLSNPSVSTEPTSTHTAKDNTQVNNLLDMQLLTQTQENLSSHTSSAELVKTKNRKTNVSKQPGSPRRSGRKNGHKPDKR